MCGKNFVFLCCVLLIASSLKSHQISINNNKKDDNLTLQYEIDTDSTTNYNDEIKTSRYDLHEKFIDNTLYAMKNEFSISSNNENRENVDSILYKLRHSVHNHEDDDKISINSDINLTNVNDKENLTSQEIYEDLFEINESTSYEVFENSNEDSNENNIVPYMCHNITCIKLCCPLGNRMSMNGNKCIPEDIKYDFPNVYGYTNDSMQSENKRVDEVMQLIVYNSCQRKPSFTVPYGRQYDYKIFANGSIYLSYFKIFVKPTSYCLAVFLERGDDMLEVTFCSETVDEIKKSLVWETEVRVRSFAFNLQASFRIVSILFLVLTFLVYSIFPELQNVHSFMLRNYTAALSIGYIMMVINIFKGLRILPYPLCIALAFFEYFYVISGYFWLSVMSFNMWRTFRGFCSLQRNVRQRGKKKLVYYVIFAWGCPFILAIICVIIMEFISLYLPRIMRPQFRLGNCWFHDNDTFVLYYYGLKSVCIISSVCLSISTALKIKHYEKETGLCLSNSENERYNDNKKWFNLYMKLFIMMFIVMGINWSLITTSWLSGNLINYYIPFVTNLLDIVQNFCIFVIFVWKKKIKLMLLKRFSDLFPKIQRQSQTNATSFTMVPL